MNALYNVGIRTYFFGIRVAALFGHRKARQMQEGRRDWARRLVRQVKSHTDSHLWVWFHAASLGEFEQGRPIMERLRREQPDYKILLTFFSPSGYEVRKDYAGADVVAYLPYDTAANARRFLRIVQPEVAVFIKYEFWGNMLEALDRRDIPTYLVSGIFRRRQSFFRWYGALMRPCLRRFTHFFVQDDESRRLLGELGHDNVTVCGDTRFDRVIDINRAAKVLPWAAAFAARSPFTLVAGSTWPKDEDLLLDYFNRTPSMRLIIAPHEIHEEHIQYILSKLTRKAVRYSQLKQEGLVDQPSEALDARLADADCVVVDAIGFLSSVYRYGQAAYVGGGFGVGIHNTLEAAVYGIPVVFGPNHTAFREAIGLKECGGGFAIDGAEALNATLERLRTDAAHLAESGRRAGHYVTSNSGASDVVYATIFGNGADKR